MQAGLHGWYGFYRPRPEAIEDSGAAAIQIKYQQPLNDRRIRSKVQRQT
jgi:hypothetical protein